MSSAMTLPITCDLSPSRSEPQWMSPWISPSTWISPLEVTLPMIERSSPMMEGPIFLALGLVLLEAEVVGRWVKGVFISPADRSPIFVTLSPGSGFLVNILASPHDTVRRTEDLLGAWNRDSNRNKPLEGIVAEVPVLGSTPQRPLLP